MLRKLSQKLCFLSQSTNRKRIVTKESAKAPDSTTPSAKVETQGAKALQKPTRIARIIQVSAVFEVARCLKSRSNVSQKPGILGSGLHRFYRCQNWWNTCVHLRGIGPVATGGAGEHKVAGMVRLMLDSGEVWRMGAHVQQQRGGLMGNQTQPWTIIDL